MSEPKTIHDFQKYAGYRAAWDSAPDPFREWCEELERRHGRVNLQLNRFIEFQFRWENQPVDQRRWMDVYDVLCDILGDEA